MDKYKMFIWIDVPHSMDKHILIILIDIYQFECETNR